MRVSILFSVCMAAADAHKHRALLHIVKQRSAPFTPLTRRHYAERALSITGLPDPFVHEPIRSLQETPDEIPVEGDVLCPCIDVSEAPSVNASTDLSQDGRDALIYQNVTTYGYGCLQHDLLTTDCVKARDAGGELPQWCLKQWCWVHHATCSVRNRVSVWVPGRPYSYATCRNADVFLQSALLAQLKGQKLKVGFNSNSGGWMGAYSDDLSHYDVPLDRWRGPMISFLKNASEYAGFEIEMVAPPPLARNRSHEFFNSTSPFDECIYAAALGLVDLCVAQYSVTTRRVLVVDWLITVDQEIRLITQIQGIVVVSDWFSLVDKFGQAFNIITQPFEKSTWLFLIFCVVPMMGIMFIIHEYGRPGSVYQASETEVEENEDGTQDMTYREISILEHLGTGLYNSILSVLQGGYEETVVSHGGFIHLLGVSFFIMTIIAVYTANMAAILTDRATQGDVNSIIRALRADYRFCADRSTMKVVLKSYPNLLSEDLFVNDPDDGLPGYQDKRSLTLDNLDVGRARENSSYCHAAISTQQDLEYEQGIGQHCDKTVVGKVLGRLASGIPISQRFSPNLRGLFNKLINLNVLAKANIEDRPKARCSAVESQVRGEDKSLSIEQLAGIWFVTFAFAGLGLLIHYFKPWVKISVKSRKERRKRKEEKMMKSPMQVREDPVDHGVPTHVFGDESSMGDDQLDLSKSVSTRTTRWFYVYNRCIR